jgi:hypothetical protein
MAVATAEASPAELPIILVRGLGGLEGKEREAKPRAANLSAAAVRPVADPDRARPVDFDELKHGRPAATERRVGSWPCP